MTHSDTISMILQGLKSRTAYRIWLLSDLQQSDLARARECLELAVNDFSSWRLDCDQIWYMGDGVEGSDQALVTAMAAMQQQVLGALKLPVRYVMGNHDFDPWRDHKGSPPYPSLPFWEMMQKETLWRTIGSLEDWYFTEILGPYLVVFLSDHGSPTDGWFTTHGHIRRSEELYPVKQAAYDHLRQQMGAWPGPVITCAHYAFPGGNRPSDLLAQLLPLPARVQLHIYGHSHIGDTHWGAEHAHRKIAGIDDHDIVQVNISSLEDLRGSEVRSALLEIYTDGTLGVYFRDHRHRRWADVWLGAVRDPGYGPGANQKHPRKERRFT